MVRRCAWGTCRNDERFPHLWKRNANGDERERRQRWIKACHRGDNFECTKNSHICSFHFVDENGSMMEHPGPMSAVKSRENVRIYISYTSVLRTVNSIYGRLTPAQKVLYKMAEFESIFGRHI